MTSKQREVRVVHFLNQFFGGLGGESEANAPLQVREGPVGPGRALEQAAGGRVAVASTIVGGDNYFNENLEQAKADVGRVLAEQRPDVLVAGPAFNAGRYGLACMEACRLAVGRGIPAVTGMFPENPGVLGDRRGVYIVPTSDSPGGMGAALAAIVRIALKLGHREEVGSAESEGYLPRGVRQPGLRDRPAAERAYDMLVTRLSGKPFTTEMAMLVPERIRPASPLADLKGAKVALITTGGLVPKGNPDRLVRAGAKNWFRYAVSGLEALSAEDWESVHAGFYTAIVNQNPNYILPLSTARQLEREGMFGQIHEWLLSTTGVGTTLTDSRRIGQEMAQELRASGVDGCCLVAT